MNPTETLDTNPASPAPSTAGDVSLLDLLIVLARRRRWIAAWTVGATAAAVLVAFLLPNQYVAESVVLPPSQNSSTAAGMLSQFAGSGALAAMAGASLGIKNPTDMYVSLFRTRTVEDAMIARFDLKKRYRAKRMYDARREFEKHVGVDLGSRDGLIRINVRDKDPKMAANMANAYVDEFRKLSNDLAITEAAQRRLFFQQQLTEAKDNLAKAEESMKHTEQITGVLQIDSQAKALIESAAMLRAQVAAKQVQIQGIRSFATNDNPELVMARQQLAALQAQLAKLGGSEQESDSLLVPKGKVPEAGMEYIRRYRDVKYYETIFELIAKQFELAKLDEARQGSIIQVADAALPPDKPSSPRRVLIVVTVFLAALLGSTVWAIVHDVLASGGMNEEQRKKLALLRELWNGRTRAAGGK